ncbi:MAG: bifunctional DNA-binding transcriptional regulator/O6-methylguanine-DNA methyltransferase Ada [Bacteroidota bacterium]
MPLTLTDARWTALSTRDAQHDGRFVYAVTTTGIYCRPSCGARTPRRSHVVLFAAPVGAEAAGFRACRRCRPQDEVAPSAARVHQAQALIDERLRTDPDTPWTLEALADAVGWSRSHLQRTFTRLIGLSPRAYTDAQRVARAKAALQSGQTVLAATFEGGFGSSHALYTRIDEAFGMTPGTYRRGGAGLHIRYAIFDTALGLVLVAATERGVCATTLGDDADALVADLQARFHAATLRRDDAALGPWAEPIVRYLAGAPTQLSEAGRALLALPTDVRGTAFQHRVWAALRAIPVGETRTYGEVAAAIGRPTSSRAVAQACGANPVALVVPCHRVIGQDGQLRGYRWGAERKRQLLERERAT